MHMCIKCERLPLMAANDKLLGKLCNELNPPLRGVVKLLLASQGRNHLKKILLSLSFEAFIFGNKCSQNVVWWVGASAVASISLAPSFWIHPCLLSWKPWAKPQSELPVVLYNLKIYLLTNKKCGVLMGKNLLITTL